MRPHGAKARQSLRSAGLPLDVGDFDGAVNRACYDAARGCIEAVAGIGTAEVKTHAGLIGREEQLRLFADHGDGVRHREEAELAVSQAQAFVSACLTLIDEKKMP